MTPAQLKHRARQLALYAVIGVLATAAHYAVMAMLLNAGWLPVQASTAGAFCGAVVAYIANRKWTFEMDHSIRRMMRFMAVAALGLLMNAIGLMAIYQWLIPSVIWAQLLTTALVFVATFLINLKWSFA
ncbi:MAG: GtrA family protein [Gammaproteobacteria bacterium]|nr:GtrA family protein [Gammaproteobacteria bacterium]